MGAGPLEEPAQGGSCVRKRSLAGLCACFSATPAQHNMRPAWKPAPISAPPCPAGGEGSSAAEAAAQLHLAEDVYGPFSGQVQYEHAIRPEQQQEPSPTCLSHRLQPAQQACHSLCVLCILGRPAALRLLATQGSVFRTPFCQVTSAARQALRRAVLEADPRLVEALFLCEVRRRRWIVCSRSVKLKGCFMLEAEPRLVEALWCARWGLC